MYRKENRSLCPSSAMNSVLDFSSKDSRPLNIDTVSVLTRFSLPHNDMSKISPFAIHKTLIGIGGGPKSVKRLRFGNLLIETTPALQTKSFLLAKSFLNNPVTVSPHKTLNSCWALLIQRYLKVSLIRVSLRTGESQ
ncbi:uncharacterized protein TNCV_1118191 [Trichonephila clavipes]|uniref:Uncharacterized protein n=1 Tax=Trichonephila clavipes TaxID=2585209 RepID=A0A8X6VSY2_TRICX|nr:uncharacterized protein TNCV_1118191 [Trichonephila clavipes]